MKNIIKIQVYLCLLTTMILSSCDLAINTPTNIPPTENHSSLATVTPSVELNIIEKCPVIFSSMEQSVTNLNGNIVLLQKPKNSFVVKNVFLFNLENNQEINILKEDELLSYTNSIAVSPNYKFLAYGVVNTNNETIHLILSNSVGERQKIISLESDIPFPMYGNVQKWLNDQQLLLDRNIFNPYTEETILFDPESFPDNAPDDFGIHSIQFDPTITRVIYTSSDATIVMVDIETKQVLAEVKAPYAGMPKIAWSSDAKWVAIVGENSKTGSNSDEIFLIDRDGNEVKQVTNLSTFEGSGAIFNLAWSPDNRQIAFWQNDISSSKKGLRLFVLDIEAEKITSYCTWGEPKNTTFFGPIWSPDSKHLLIGDLRTKDTANSIVIDIEKNLAIIVGENFIPVGWMLP